MSRRRERIGRCEFIPFQRKDGRVETALMYPLLNEFGGTIRWLTIEQGEALAKEWGLR